MHSAGIVSFLVRPYELQNAGNFTVSIDSVAKATGNSSSLELTPADFSSLTPSSKELTLSANGLNKVNSANDLKDDTAYDYSVAFKFTTTSDTVSNKTVLYTSTVSLYKHVSVTKLVSVTKVMLENMIKKTPTKTVQNRNAIDTVGSDSFSIDFNKASISSDLKSVTFNNMSGMTDPTKDSTYSPYTRVLRNLTFGGTAEDRKFASHLCKNATISTDGSLLTLNYVFTLNRGYVLDNDISFITNEGLNIRVQFLGTKKGKWVANYN